ncbi:MAG: hypothetical protein ACRYGC_14985 [Janthinobacterium lividum]
MTDTPMTSPALQVPAALWERVERHAEAEGLSPDELVCRCLEQGLPAHTDTVAKEAALPSVPPITVVIEEAALPAATVRAAAAAYAARKL